jgi:hypothetical protein
MSRVLTYLRAFISVGRVAILTEEGSDEVGWR